VISGSYDPYANPESVLRNLFSIICRRLINFRPLVRMQLAAVSMMVILTFIEPPVWCQRWDQNDEGGCVHLLTMTGIALGEDESSDPVLFYPNTKSMLLTTHQSMIVEYACLLVVLFFSLLRFGRYVPSFQFFIIVDGASALSIVTHPNCRTSVMACLSHISFVGVK